MSLSTGKVGITLIGLPGSGKTTLSQEVAKQMPGWQAHDHDNDGLESEEFGLGKGGVADAVKYLGDRQFLIYEGGFTERYYGRKDEGKVFSLDNVLFASSGSLVKSSRAMQYIRKRTHVILLDVPTEVILKNIENRNGGSERIVGMNGGPDGETPSSPTLIEELQKRVVLYLTNNDSIFHISSCETVDQTARRLLCHIQEILTSN